MTHFLELWNKNDRRASFLVAAHREGSRLFGVWLCQRRGAGRAGRPEPQRPRQDCKLGPPARSPTGKDPSPPSRHLLARPWHPVPSSFRSLAPLAPARRWRPGYCDIDCQLYFHFYLFIYTAIFFNDYAQHILISFYLQGESTWMFLF